MCSLLCNISHTHKYKNMYYIIYILYIYIKYWVGQKLIWVFHHILETQMNILGNPI